MGNRNFLVAGELKLIAITQNIGKYRRSFLFVKVDDLRQSSDLPSPIEPVPNT